MNTFFLRTFSLLTVLLFLVTSAGAADIVLEDDTLIVKGVDDSIGLGAFSVVLTYAGNVSIQSVDGAPGFMVASNILNDEFQTFIAGIATEGQTGDIPVASVRTTGAGDIVVYVRELANVKGDPISYTNEEFTGAVPTPPSGSEVSASEITVSQTQGIPSATPVATTASPTEATATSTEMPVDPIVQSATSATPATPALGGDNESPAVTETNAATIPPTQSPYSIFVVLISFASLFIFKKGK
ncbi:hypothetical protein L1S32_00895 [Methanogenium sp. S4BF]|uniref:hypothetical protein n=1 Tax=Methanogenium sp. S4BF TaxID=1789226 RepID=UPI00241618A0|nr:hypothetical protein [Methanogenium sp. S4BF]WFN34711.1 hypothetical protein L1S32_00895 [Methanogenium sp. S4BF]